MLQGGREQDQYIKSIVYVYTINEKSQNETKETISFTTGSKRIKRLKINKRSTKFIVWKLQNFC